MLHFQFISGSEREGTAPAFKLLSVGNEGVLHEKSVGT
jgi:hypothetical protein